MRFLAKYEPHAYLLLRLVFGFLFACHGVQKLFAAELLHGPHMAAGFNPGFIGSVIELVAGALIFIGLFTRIAAFIASGEMAVAYFMAHDHSAMAVQHGHASFFPIVNGGELAVIYCFVALLIATHGAGGVSIDRK